MIWSTFQVVHIRCVANCCVKMSHGVLAELEDEDDKKEEEEWQHVLPPRLDLDAEKDKP